VKLNTVNIDIYIMLITSHRVLPKVRILSNNISLDPSAILPLAGTMPPTADQADRRLYQPLDRNSRQIRLIEILPTQPDETIECKLHTVTLNPDTYYVCISYVWGDPSITEEIIVNGVRKQVTVNLATALRHLKKHWVEIESEADPDVDTSKFRLWADALCINQDNPLERGHQVGLMGDIYSSAEMVLAWLSSDDRDVASGFNVLDRVGP
jgi:hypothetical protein